MSEADEIVKELKSLKRKSMDRIKEVLSDPGGWLILSKEATSHKMILGSLLGEADKQAVIDPPTGEKTPSQDDKDLQDVMDGK